MATRDTNRWARLGGKLAHRGDRLLASAWRRLAPEPDGRPTEGGAGRHALGPADLQPDEAGWPRGDALAPLGDVAVAAGAGRADAAFLDHLAPVPAQGSAPADVVARLVHMGAVASWASLSAPDSRRLAGAASGHAGWLVREALPEQTDPTRVLRDAALLIAGLVWPALESAQAWRGQGLGGLARGLPALLGSDGSPVATPDGVARALWVAALARAWTVADSGTFPSPADQALSAGALALHRMGGDTGRLPGVNPWPPHPLPGILPLGPRPLAHTLASLVGAWGLEPADSAGGLDPACERLAGRPPPPTDEPPMAGPAWRQWTWRDTGTMVAHRTIKGRPSRIFCTGRGAAVRWELGDLLVVDSTLGDTLGHDAFDLRASRVDGPSLRVDYARRRQGRVVRARQAVLVVEDVGASDVCWSLDPAWELRAGDQGWSARMSGLTLVVKVDTPSHWSLAPGPAGSAQVLCSAGEGPFKISFEIR